MTKQNIGPAEVATRLRNLLQEVTAELIDYPQDLEILDTVSSGGSVITLTIRTLDSDVGAVLGAKGKNAKALRVLFEAMAGKYRKRVFIEVSDPRPQGYKGKTHAPKKEGREP